MSESETPLETPRVRAPEIGRDGLEWFNVEKPLSLKDLRGKLVILDFWTFCCINCMHVLPALKKVEAAYPDEVAVIGVHSPKFAAEQRPENLKAAIARYGVEHPVVNDISFQLWREYAVRAWPTLVFIGPEGHVLGQMAGEPDSERLLTAVSELVERWDTQGVLHPCPMDISPERDFGGEFAFPGKIKPVPGDDRFWALADAGHHQIVLLDDDGEEVVRFGSGQPGFADGPAETAQFNAPQGLIADEETIYVADTGNHAVRRIDLSSGTVATLAGTGERGMVVHEEEPALAAALASPWDLELDGGVLYIANAGTHQILELDIDARELRPLAGNGGEEIIDGPGHDAQLAQPSGLALDRDSNALYFADSETSSVRAVTLSDRAVHTLVGEGLFEFGAENGPFELARMQHPLGIAVTTGEVLVADSYNHKARVLDLAARRVRDLDDGFECMDDLCLPPAEPAGIWADGPDRVLLVDTNNHRVLEYLLTERTYRTWAG
ncbi:thioredoxin-like domain-containing protein [Ferruginivarius sediminum]|uniref:Thioredoxin domain-containing protein n=1 Tax=Ferruginivarius sediminum TaxID=2661937 RepID=A0A369TCL1_9PROT|nr:thioredoxin-like domain-containing protein [Ferruginivarius sediminum]RDD62562.1 hypothetical protein DRB17_07940 [Ferruginivarius sediminum]